MSFYFFRKRGWKRGGSSSRAATFVEYVIVAPLFLALMAGLFDMARYFAVYGLVNFQAQRTVDRLVKRPLAANLEMNCGGDVLCLDAQTQLRADLGTILASSGRVPLVRPYDPAHLPRPGIPFAMITPFRYSASFQFPGDSMSVAFVRPGERVEFYAQAGQYLNHPTRPCQAGVPGANQDFALLLRGEPIVVVIEATVSSVFPFIRNYRARGYATGYSRGERIIGEFQTGGPPPPPSSGPPSSSSPPPSGGPPPGSPPIDPCASCRSSGSCCNAPMVVGCCLVGGF